MNSIPGYLVIPVLALLFFTFPGLLFKKVVPGLRMLPQIAVTIFMSLSFWVCISWFITWIGLPLDTSAFSLLLLFIVYFLIVNRRAFNALFSKSGRPHLRDAKLHHTILFLTLVLLCAPLLFFTIPPGCDTAMHGYITRLIINQNGLPNSYRPILPVDYFGSYSAGYHVITALISGVKPHFLRHAINFLSVIVYPITLLALVFALLPFFSERTAVYTGIIFFGINHTLLGTIGWGGNPSILAFAFCLYSVGMVIYAIQNKSAGAMYSVALAVAAIPLVHAIPAITFVYLASVGFGLLLYHYREMLKWLILHSAATGILILILLAPFLSHFKNENSTELLVMIRNWQNEMMGGKLTNNNFANLAVAAEQIKYRICDVLTILTGLSLAVLFYFKRYRQIIYVSIFIVSVYLLVYNSGVWLLPFSEILYPERVVYFMILCWCFVFGYAISELETLTDKLVLFNGKLSVYTLVTFILLAASAGSIGNEYSGLYRDDKINCNNETRAAFDWINQNTEKGALIEVSYGDAGMWVPAFTNRAVLGGHIHFIHLVQQVPELLAASAAPRYIFVTKRDLATNSALVTKTATRTKLFANNEVAIYR
jgi:hypothetical protein